jgi:hypothetical protein
VPPTYQNENHSRAQPSVRLPPAPQNAEENLAANDDYHQRSNAFSEPNHWEPPATCSLIYRQCDQMQDPISTDTGVPLRSAIGGTLRNQEFKLNLAEAAAATSRTSSLV